MKRRVCYISRYRLKGYHSIEELFMGIKAAMSKIYPCNWYTLKCTGGHPWVIFKNLWSLKPNNDVVYHITGDVHYMAIRLGRKAVLTVHDVGSILKTKSSVKLLYLKLFWFWWPAARVRYITVISEFTKKELAQIIPRYRHKIKVIPNPVHPIFEYHSKPFNSELPTILLIGTKPNKNLEHTLKALHGIPCKLLIVGELNDAQKRLLNDGAYAYNNVSNCTLSEIYQCYVQCDLLCFVSTYEGFGMPIIEAQAAGRPVITSNVGAMKEVAGDAALLVSPQSKTALRDAVLEIVKNTDLRTSLVNRGLENVKRFSLNAVTLKYNALYEQIQID